MTDQMQQKRIDRERELANLKRAYAYRYNEMTGLTVGGPGYAKCRRALTDLTVQIVRLKSELEAMP